MTTFVFTVNCHDGHYEVAFSAEDEPNAWTQLVRMFVLRGVVSIQLKERS